MTTVYPKIPVNPITLAFNGKLINGYLEYFSKVNLPQYELVITSGYRSPAKNEQVGGATHSAHMYNLARDFVLKNKSTGKILDDSAMKQVFTEFVKPKWEGYALWEPKKSGDNTGHFHVNINREFSKYSMWGGMLAAIAAGGFGIKWLIEKGRKNA